MPPVCARRIPCPRANVWDVSFVLPVLFVPSHICTPRLSSSTSFSVYGRCCATVTIRLYSRSRFTCNSNRQPATYNTKAPWQRFSCTIQILMYVDVKDSRQIRKAVYQTHTHISERRYARVFSAWSSQCCSELTSVPCDDTASSPDHKQTGHTGHTRRLSLSWDSSVMSSDMLLHDAY